jgi:hypothetical protein
MVYVERFVKKVRSNTVQGGNDSESSPDSQTLSFSDLREVHAWVLLGEPGAGKTTSLKVEAAACNGCYLKIDEFVDSDIDPSWNGKTLFLDGLDEIRAGNLEGSILTKVCKQLKRMSCPKFRVACRAAEWNGELDRSTLNAALNGEQIEEFSLLLLAELGVAEILLKNHHCADPQAFIRAARLHGVEALLFNPQFLQLLVLAIRELNGEWPNNRTGVYEASCRILAKESNDHHVCQARRSHTTFDIETLLTAAGYLFSVLLLSDKTGIALYESDKSERFSLIDDLKPRNSNEAYEAVKKSLFVLSSSSERRLEPNHRSIAEYLSARWIAYQIDRAGLSVHRIQNLVFGFDRRTVAGLRGLYGWLATLSEKARTAMIEADPLTVLLYGDARSLSPTVKRHLLKSLIVEIEKNPSIVSDLRRSNQEISFFEESIETDFLQLIDTSARDDKAQRVTLFFIMLLSKVQVSARLRNVLLEIVKDDTRWEVIRHHALAEWLTEANKNDSAIAEALRLLEAINNQQISDPDDDLVTLLLERLFPHTITSADLLDYLHPRKHKSYFGSYWRFWLDTVQGVLTDPANINELAKLLDELARRTELVDLQNGDSFIPNVTERLIVNGVRAIGDEITDERLLNWLSIGLDQFGDMYRNDGYWQPLSNWFSMRPERYKGVVAALYIRSTSTASPRKNIVINEGVLRGILRPSDMAIWHWEQLVNTQNEELKRQHFEEVMGELKSGHEVKGLTLDDIISWVSQDAGRADWLKPHLYVNLQDWRLKSFQHRQNQLLAKRNFGQKLRSDLGSSTPIVPAVNSLAELAGVWLSRFTEVVGETPLSRFQDLFPDDYEGMYSFAKQSFYDCPAKQHLPLANEIVDAYLSSKVHNVVWPCLIGMDLRWEQGFACIDELPEESLRSVICFRLAYHRKMPPDWFSYLALSRPSVVAEVFIEFASRILIAKHDDSYCIHELESTSASQTHPDPYVEVRLLVVPTLLRDFPLRALPSQLHDLKSLLRVATSHLADELPDLVGYRLAKKSLDSSQRVIWLTTGALVNPNLYVEKLRDYAGGTWQRVEIITQFLSREIPRIQPDSEARAYLLCQLIEIYYPFAQGDESGMLSIGKSPLHLDIELNTLLSAFSNETSQAAIEQIEALLALPKMRRIEYSLKRVLYEMRQRVREQAFTFLPMQQVIDVLQNKIPTNAADLFALALDSLTDIEVEIRASPNNLYKHFWSHKRHGHEGYHKDEDSCRDALLTLLEVKLHPFGIYCEKEGYYVNDKRADIKLSSGTAISLPIEIKGAWHEDLWTSAENQLIKQYAIDPEANGHGIYLVFWFGDIHRKPPVGDGGTYPTSPTELETRLQTMIPIEHSGKVKVRVIDVSWPPRGYQ